MASAPARTAANASSRRVIPQIFTRVRMASLKGRGSLPEATIARKPGQCVLLRILDVREIKPMARRGHAAFGPIARSQHLPCPLRRTLAGTDLHQHAGDVTYHVMQEGVGVGVD